MTSIVKPSKEDRQAFVSNIWLHLLPFKVKIFVNKNDHVRIEPVDAKGREVFEYWANLLEELCEIDGVADVAAGRFQPSQGVIVKVNPQSGIMKVKGENYWDWFVANFERMLNQSAGTGTMGPQRGESIAIHRTRSGPEMDSPHGLPITGSLPALYPAAPTYMAELTLPDRVNLVDSLLGDLPKTGAIRGGLSYIYPLWRALIGLWLAQNRTVTIATSQLDAERFADILTLMIACCDTTDFTFQVSIYVPVRCDLGRKFSHVADVARRIVESRRKKRKFITSEKLNWAMRAVQVKHAKAINYNFISGHSTYDGEMMVTSASFHKQHLITNASSSIWFAEISTESLKKHYIQALFAACVETQL